MYQSVLVKTDNTYEKNIINRFFIVVIITPRVKFSPITNKMKKDRLYMEGTIHQDFTFDEKVADVFDDMVSRSVPFYQTVIIGIADLLKRHLKTGTTIYDLGCSTGSTLLQLSRILNREDIKYVGLDNADPMLEKARLKSEHFCKSDVITFMNRDITACSLPDAGAVICNYTMQFLRPLSR